MRRAAAVQPQPIRPGVRCISVGGTSPRLFRLCFFTFSGDSLLPRKGSSGKLEFHGRANATEAKGASPIPDGLSLKLLKLDLDEILPGRGDGLTADSRWHFPAPFSAEEHLSFTLSHAEEPWDATLQAAIMQCLGTLA